jgi:hypothetical protein
MGWGRTLLLGDIGNRLDIEDTEQDIAKPQTRDCWILSQGYVAR